MKFDIIVADPPWGSFNDKLTMNAGIKRGAASNYSVLSNEDIIKLPVGDLAADNSVLALWVPSSMLEDGLNTMKAWGFRQTQTHIWVKVKLNPFESFFKANWKSLKASNSVKELLDNLKKMFGQIDYDGLLSFGMGRLFRQCHEICLVGVKGKIYSELRNKSQRSVHFDINKKHSAKPEILQDRLELMFPGLTNKLELFARRDKIGWMCVGNQAPNTAGEDIRETIDKLKLK